MHCFETSTSQIVLKKGWPQVINFQHIEKHLRKFYAEMVELMEDPSPSHFYQSLVQSIQKLGHNEALGSGGHYEFSSKYGLGTG